MTTIRILPEILSNQIAAGEVVQRPVNAVKELVENSIDAKATRITIEIEKGGKSLIRVSDDGIGLSRDDALLAIERYATSKIFTKEDLFCISTMGFRGEALPSIASVSKFTLVTRTADSDVGTRIDISGGRMLNVSDAGAPVGTLVEVRHLFFNTPARKKFLKAESTEVSHIADAVFGMALGHPDIEFRLFINGRLQKSFSLNDGLLQRAMDVLGNDVANRLYMLDFSQGPVRVHGYCSSPMVTRSTSSRIFLYVNRRLVHDRGIISAIFAGYKGRIMKGKFPLGVFFIDIDYDQVDVNVHPSKREIKFFDSRQVYQAVVNAIEDAMAREQKNAPVYSNTRMVSDPKPVPLKKHETFAFYDPDFSVHENLKIDEPPALNIQAAPATSSGYEDQYPSEGLIQHHEKTQVAEPDQVRLPGETRVIGQVLGTYIVAETKEGLMLIDQHAAHERIVYEKLKLRHQLQAEPGQMLVVPQTLELNFKEADVLTKISDELRLLGVIIEPFGGTTFVIKSVPSIMDEKDIKPLIIDLVEKRLVQKDPLSAGEWIEDCLILMACHSAIRAHLNLTRMEMEKLIRDLENCQNPRHCPHGRPILISWDKHQIEKLFKRVV
ncbi:MAG: DNA mismatch repair endonuclease MutL [Proteobacteria bacterium]|nr:DNA mismatch repair endonuclease MutL [Pseudomonadota bacterium]MBU1389260.1 DNA mismatch repair endonuclease MutL [Pseudomonadota bacterium]MBU1544080.1 DNA mismatch repair endonuclease MutL [Pseudomonadota bacterium]MBU2482086.1 DNA mismatch repair endonuclease MutL [Pseudomonadota bacterium]